MKGLDRNIYEINVVYDFRLFELRYNSKRTDHDLMCGS